jgi:hypothetical protein
MHARQAFGNVAILITSMGLLVGCSGHSEQATSAATATSATSASVSETTVVDTGTASATTTGAASKRTSAAQSSASRKVGACTNAQTNLALTPYGTDQLPDSGQGAMLLTVRNTGSTSCTLRGVAEVVLVATDNSAGHTTWQLYPSDLKVPTVTLDPGRRAVAELAYLSRQETDDNPPFTPGSVRITLPDQSSSRSLPWPGPSLTYQDGATHPGTWIAPFISPDV